MESYGCKTKSFSGRRFQEIIHFMITGDMNYLLFFINVVYEIHEERSMESAEERL